ncbi:IS66 family transposase [Novosphingobium gossypii]
MPLDRQSQTYASQGVEVSRSTMAGWLGQASWTLQPPSIGSPITPCPA